MCVIFKIFICVNYTKNIILSLEKSLQKLSTIGTVQVNDNKEIYICIYTYIFFFAATENKLFVPRIAQHNHLKQKIANNFKYFKLQEA